MSQQELLRKVVETLVKANIDYMVTGSIASSLQGEPRSSIDIDFIIDIKKPSVKKLINAFPAPEYYLDEESIIDAMSKKSMFNLINVVRGEKVDFWLLTADPFDKSRFFRRYEEVYMGAKVYVSSPEDTILAKLHWAKLSGGSNKQFIDALGVYEVQYAKLDQNYLENWAEELDVQSYLKEIEKQAKVL